VLLWDFFTRVMQGVSTAFLEDVWSRNFINLFATPLTLPEYLTGLVATSIATSLVGLLVMLLLAGTVFGLPWLAFGWKILPFVMVLFLFGIVLGVLACAMVLRLGPASEWLVWPIPALMSPFAAVFYPLSTLPAWMQAIAHLLPASYVFEGLRQMMAGGPFPIASLLVGFTIALAELLLAGWVFGSIFRYAVRSGLLARYSAESTG
jgi:ABC-2 type transport system permease protein